MALSPVPTDVLDALGHARIGTYAGTLGRVQLTNGPGALSRLARFVRHKRWHYTLITTSEVVALAAVVDLGYTANAFACAVDLKSSKVLADESFLGPPGPLVRVGDRPADGLEARFSSLGVRIGAAHRPAQRSFAIDAEIAAMRSKAHAPFHLHAEISAEGPTPLTVIAPVAQDGVNVTQKSAVMPVTGRLEAGGQSFSLDGGLCGMDYTQGMLARRTAWRWAFAQGRLPDGTPVGLNLVEGFNEGASEANENALWLDGQLLPLARARFAFDRADYTRGWTIETLDGGLYVEFTPLHVHHELRDYKLVRSRFVQVVGLYSGEVRHHGRTVRLENVPGVTEDQDVLW
jgi:hypothetical protein